MIPRTAINEALALLPLGMDSLAARVMLVAIGYQESGFERRRQIVGGKPVGPAKGFWQFENGGGCKGVVTHPASAPHMRRICQQRGVEFNSAAIWDAIEHDDVLAAAAARLLLWTDPKPLPVLGNQQGAWALYDRVWRPGQPHPDRWPANYAKAMTEVAK